MRIAHLSDLHFYRCSYQPMQLLSKRWVGNFNFFFHRRFQHSTKPLFSLPKLLKHLAVTHVIITGDLTTTSLPEEYDLAFFYVHLLKQWKFHVFVIPGNHDHYTKHSYQVQRFYQYFPPAFSSNSFNLKDHKVTKCHLTEQWSLVALDTVIPTPLTASNGLLSTSAEAHLLQLMEHIPQSKKILLINHFPFLQNDRAKRLLLRGERLQSIFRQYPNICFYLHGHTHHSSTIDLRAEHLPITLDSGSLSHRSHGSWLLIEISQEAYQCTTYRYQRERWQKSDCVTFSPYL